MASRTSAKATKPRKATKTSNRPRPRRGPVPARGGRMWWAVGVAALVGAVAIGWTLTGNDGDRPVAGAPVERFHHAHGLAVPAWAPQAVFLSTHEGLIRIENGQWSYASTEQHDFMGFAAHPTQPNLLYSSGHPADGSGVANPVGFMVSTDGGATWQVRALEGETDFHAMAVGAGGAAIYGWNVTGQPGLFRSTDDGNTWTTVDAPGLAAAGGVIALAADPDDPDRLWAATGAGLLESRDAGGSWQPVVPDVPVTAVTIDPADPDRLLAYAAPPGQGLLESHDGGQTWTPVGWQLPVGDDAVGHLAIHPQDPRQVYAATFAEDLLRSADGGRTWQTMASAGAPGR